MAEEVLKIKDIRKNYGTGQTTFEALKGINFSIHQGESVAIIGKSGSGKSTLMHILALLDQPTSGEIYLFGQDIKNKNAKELNKIRNRTFGFIFQQFFMNPKDTVLENVVLPLKIAGISSKKRKEMAMSALESVELAGKAKNKANDLSGGKNNVSVLQEQL
ncbi:putative ABC transport system ATP-binding protein [Melissococcus plutonius]|nr:putative ABC transport system ATP-binding protein [Melissococcus plutonius]